MDGNESFFFSNRRDWALLRKLYSITGSNKEAGMLPQLLRLSVGLEPTDHIIPVLKESLDLVHSNS